MVKIDERLPSYTCPRCGKTSYHPKDVEHRYCGHCHVFEDIADLMDEMERRRDERE